MNEREIFIEALEKGSLEERRTYLDTACGDNPPLRSRIELLLKSHESAGSLLDHPVLGDDLPETVVGHTGGLPSEPPVDCMNLLGFLQPADESDHLGRLGQYEILEVVGRGGMGLVFKAQDTRLHRIVALKVLLPELAASPTARKRFLREARAAAAVSHDHVVTTYAVEESEAGNSPTSVPPYLAMEFIDGQSLQEKIDRQGALDLREILRIGMQAASGLAAAHAQGLIHRDVKPSNILLQNGVERVQITDFGLARAADDAAFTRTGEVAGTPQYMSPEQAQGQNVDARSDLFSLGSVLYAMCTGRSPFRAETTVASLHRVCNDTPRPIREVNPDIPKWLVAIIGRLLKKDPDDRFQTAEEVAKVLGKCLAHVQDPSSAPLPGGVYRMRRLPRGGRRWLAAASVLLTLTAALGVSEATGVTGLSATVVRIVTGEGTLVIEVDDPSVQVSLDGEELSITGAGLKEIRLRPGQYQFQAVKDGVPIKQELVTIARNGQRVMRVTREPAGPQPLTPAAAEKEAFVVLSGAGQKIAAFSTLADAVQGSSDGDTIEVRGSGPFIIDSIEIRGRALVIRAGDGFRPIIRLSHQGAQMNAPMLRSDANLVVQGLEFQRLGQSSDIPRGPCPVAIWGNGAFLRIANCEFRLDGGPLQVCVYADSSNTTVDVRNCCFVVRGSRSYCLSSGNLIRRCIVANCVLIGGHLLGIHDFGFPHDRGANVVLTNNTAVSPYETIPFKSLPDSQYYSPDGKRNSLAEPTRVDARHNIFDTVPVLRFVLHDEAPHPRDDFESLAHYLLSWRDEQNLYGPRRCAITWKLPEDVGPPPSVTNPEEWKQFWKEPDVEVTEGVIRYQGGDLLSRLASAPESITPDDVRLRSDSAGYQAGPDGKDLGANVDLVGPGEAYELWKLTPEYQDWQEETRRLIVGAAAQAKQPFVVLSGEGAEVVSFETLADAVLGSSPGDTIEIRGDGPFISEQIGITHPLLIRAGSGCRPIVRTTPEKPLESNSALFDVRSPLALEGLELQYLAPSPPGEHRTDVIVASAPLQMANCRLVLQSSKDFHSCCLNSWSAVRLINSEVMDCGNQETLSWLGRADQFVMENCIQVGFSIFNFREPEASLRLIGNTMIDPRRGPVGIRVHATPRDNSGYEPTRIVAARNCFDAGNSLFLFYQSRRDDSSQWETLAGWEALLPQLIAWDMADNLFAATPKLLALGVNDERDWQILGSDVSDWRRFWKAAETSTLKGTIRYQGGDLLARALAAPEKLTPNDFRLRPDSAGYRAGPDGKDLGADVDLVGPGEAYERWKLTPEYAKWLEDVARLMAGAGSQDAVSDAAAESESQPDTEQPAKDN